MPDFSFTPGERHIFKRREYVPLSEWAAAHLTVKDGPYAGGRYRRDVNPYLAGIMDTWSAPEVKEVVVCGSAQTGKTLIMHAAIAYCVDMRPGAPRMLAMQDDDSLAKVAANKLLPIFKASGPVRSQLGKARAARISFKDGSSLFLASAQSPGQRASISVQDLFLDEEALYKQIAGQGLPVEEFKERTRSYAHKSKVLRVSKPIGGPECTIVQALDESDELRRYFVRCPVCGCYQPMQESGLVVPDKTAAPQEVERRHLARYQCSGCKALWTDAMRDQAVAHGRWEAEFSVPDAARIGFHLPAILSKAVSLSEIMAAKMRADSTDAPAVRQQYINGYWAEGVRAVELETDEEALLRRRDPNLPPLTVPGDAVALTAGIDVQARGFWFVVIAWRADMSSAIIDYGRLTDWDSVAALMETRYPYEENSPKKGESLAIWRAGIDSGGTRTAESTVSRTEEVYAFVRRYGAGRLFACKGASHESYTPVRATSIDRLPSSRMRIPGGLWLYLLDTHYFKSLVFARFEENARQPMTLHSKADEMLTKQLASEELIRDRNGKQQWVRKRKDNHMLDCTCMASACVDGAWLPSFEMIVERELTAAADRREQQPQPSAGNTQHTAARAAIPQRQPTPRAMPATRSRPAFLRGRSDY